MSVYAIMKTKIYRMRSVTDMIFGNFEKNRKALEEQHEKAVFHEKSGLLPEELKKECQAIENGLGGASRMYIKANVIDFILRNARLSVDAFDIFAHRLDHGNITASQRISWKIALNENEMADMIAEHRAAQKSRLYMGDLDYSHTCPEWSYVLGRGITGILSELKENARRDGLSEEQKDFYASVIQVYEGVKVYMLRLAAEAKSLSKGNDEAELCAKTLEALTVRAPETLIEAMQLTLTVYYLQTFLDCSYVRSLGNLDSLYLPFWRTDIESGRYTEKELREIIKYFMIKFYSFKNPNNIPFYICGTDEYGNAVINELSYVLLDVYNELEIHDPKIQIRCNKNTPRALIDKALGMIAHGNNSIVFLNDEVVIRSLQNIGQSYSKAANYAPIGCYEPGSVGNELPCTCSGRVNLAKAMELTMKKKADSFEEFYANFRDSVAYAVRRCQTLINAFEKYYPIINPSPIFSGTVKSCVRRGVDMYAGGVKYNNTSISVFGLATAVDSVMAVKKLVFEEQKMTFSAFGKLLENNWNDADDIRLECKNKYPKYGNYDRNIDEICSNITALLNELVNNAPNGRGGVYRLGLFSIDWIHDFGKKTGATPDGRKSGEPLSKNLSASLGADRNGVTGLIRSAAKIDFTGVPDGGVLDIVLHCSAVKGDDGMAAFFGLLKTYFNLGGMAIQFNVLDPSVLRAAQESPEKYRNLQIRLCGWNVYFVDLSKKEQDEFIKMSENAT